MGYRCGNDTLGSQGPAFPCLMGGECMVTDDGLQYCVCPAGWQHDFLGFGHFPNCTLPSNFLPIFFMVFTIVFWLVFGYTGVMLRWSTTQGRLLIVSKASMLWAFTTWIHVLCVFLEGGLYEAGLVSFAFVSIIGFIVSYRAAPIVLEPILMRAGFIVMAKRMETWLFRITVLNAINTIGFTGGLLYTCREVNPDRFNALMAAILVQVLFLLLAEIGGTILAARKLRHLLPREATTVRRQLSAILHFNYIVFVAGIITMTCVIIWLIFGSFPFFYLQWSTTQCVVLCIMVFLQPLLNAMRSKSTDAPTRYSGRREPLSGHEDDPSSLTATASSSRKIGLGLKAKRGARMRKLKFMSRITEIDEQEARASRSSGRREDHLEPFSDTENPSST